MIAKALREVARDNNRLINKFYLYKETKRRYVIEVYSTPISDKIFMCLIDRDDKERTVFAHLVGYKTNIDKHKEEFINALKEIDGLRNLTDDIEKI